MNTPFGYYDFEQPEYLWLLLAWVPIVLLVRWTRRTRTAKRKWVSAGLRALVLLLLVLALAGLTRKTPIDALSVIFVVDNSSSVGQEGKRQASTFINEALKHKRKDDMAGVVVFGDQAVVDVSPTTDLSAHEITSAVSPHHTDIAAGLRLGAAIMPPDRARRVVVLSDGAQTRGNVENQVLLSANSELDVASVVIGGERGPDALLEDLSVPARLDRGSAYRLRVVARSAQPGTGRIRFYRNERYLGDRPVTLSGDNATIVEVSQMAESAGLYRYRAVLEMDDERIDTVPQNNVVMGTVQVTGRPQVLLVTNDKRQSKYVERVLREQNIALSVVSSARMPSTLGELRPYAAVIFSDVPAFQLTQRQMRLLETYVHDLGRGFMMLGGPNSYGVGGYYKTPVEEILPVKMDLEDKTRFPTVAVVMALDKSCSMGGGAGSKLGMAKEAAILSTDLLEDRDELGVIGFDGASTWIVPLQPLTNKASIRNTIGSIRSGGGTDIYPALSASITALQKSDASIKHVILLSDGMTSPADFKNLLTKARQNDITTTALTFGTDADRATMQNFAKWGGGKYYLVTDPTTIPAIFTREIMLASRSFLVEERVSVQSGGYSPLTRGIRVNALPGFDGYVATEAKSRATVPWLVTDGEYTSPLLAHWRTGLGRSVAFTSDAASRWSKDWVNTTSYTQTWTQVARWLIGETMGQSIDVNTEITNGELIVSVDAYDVNGDFRNFLDGSARVVAPDLGVTEIPLRQVGPGRYEGAIPVDQDGSWLAGVVMKDGEQVVGQTVSEAVQPYSPEYRLQSSGTGRMTELARLGGGGVLTEPADVFKRPSEARMVPQPIWTHCIWLAAVFFLLDVASRRLEWGTGGRAPVNRPPTRRVPRAPRRRKRTTKSVGAAVPENPVDDDPDDDDEPPPPPSKPDVDPTSYAGRLLAARGRANRRFEDSDE